MIYYSASPWRGFRALSPQFNKVVPKQGSTGAQEKMVLSLSWRFSPNEKRIQCSPIKCAWFFISFRLKEVLMSQGKWDTMLRKSSRLTGRDCFRWWANCMNRVTENKLIPNQTGEMERNSNSQRENAHRETV